jgi:predicted glutamine amidotransferase
MCKIFGLTSTAGLQMPALHGLIQRSHKALTATQKDGFGFAIGATDGNHYVEKWDNPASFPGAGQWPAIRANLAGLPVEADCVTSGTFPASTGGAFIAHARTATCSRGAENAHPHSSHGWAVVHNGVVQPTKGRTKPCDSIHILDSLVTHKGASKLHADVAGYLAILAIDPKGRLSALRDERAPLVVAWVQSLNAWAFASSDALLAEIVSAPHDKAYTLQPYRHATHTGKGWTHEEVKRWDATKAVSSKASKAFGDSRPLLNDEFPEYSGSKWHTNKKWSF